MDTDESTLPIMTESRTLSPSENPLVRNKGHGSPVSATPQPENSALLVPLSTMCMPTVRLSLLLSAEVCKKTRTLDSPRPCDKLTFTDHVSADAASSTTGSKKETAASFTPTAKAVTCGELKELEEPKTRQYEERKRGTDPAQYAEDLFYHKDYTADYELNLRPRTLHAAETYKLKVASFVEHSSEFAKDISQYPAGTFSRLPLIDMKTLCLGLENVLMHVSMAPEEDADEKVPIYVNQNVLITEFSLHFRPRMFEFLRDMRGKFELILYSALNKVYVQAIVDCIQKREKYFAHVIGEDFCVFANLTYGVKCLDFLLSGRKLQHIMLVDTTVKCLPGSSDNFVPVPAYPGRDQTDQELPKLAALLDVIGKEKDVTEAITNYR